MNYRIKLDFDDAQSECVGVLLQRKNLQEKWSGLGLVVSESPEQSLQLLLDKMHINKTENKSEQDLSTEHAKKLNIVFIGTYGYKGKKYLIEYDFGPDYTREAAEFAFLEGNYSCSCNISSFIRSVYKDFPELECGNNDIELLSYIVTEKERDSIYKTIIKEI